MGETEWRELLGPAGGQSTRTVRELVELTGASDRTVRRWHERLGVRVLDAPVGRPATGGVGLEWRQVGALPEVWRAIDAEAERRGVAAAEVAREALVRGSKRRSR